MKRRAPLASYLATVAMGVFITSCGEDDLPITSFATSTRPAEIVTLALTNDHVYWLHSDGVLERKAKAGGSVEPIATPCAVSAFAVEAEQLVFACESTVYASTAGSAPIVLGKRDESPIRQLILSNGVVFGTAEGRRQLRSSDDREGGLVFSVPIAGGTLTRVYQRPSGSLYSSTTNPPPMAVDAESVYVDVNGELLRVARSGGTPQSIVKHGAAVLEQLVVVDGYAYGVEREDSSKATLVRVDLARGSRRALAVSDSTTGSNSAIPLSLAVDATQVWFTQEFNDLLWRVPKDGAGSAVRHVSDTDKYGSSVVVDASRVYWTVSTGSGWEILAVSKN